MNRAPCSSGPGDPPAARRTPLLLATTLAVFAGLAPITTASPAQAQPAPPSPPPAGPAAAAAGDLAERQLTQLAARGISVTQAQRAAIRAAQLEPARSRSLVARARAAAVLPRLRVGIARELRRYDSYLETTDPRSNAGSELLFEVSASWSLDRLVFHPGEVSAARQALRAARARRELTELVTSLYYRRRRLQLELALTPRGPQRLELTLKLQEASALLEGLIGQKLARTRDRD